MDGAYLEWAPRRALADVVVCTWRDAPPRERGAPVLPDACIDLVWDGSTVFVAGPDTHAVAVETPDVSFVGIRFRPGAAPGFLGVPANELIDQRVPLKDLWGSRADQLASRLFERPESAAQLFEESLLERRADGPDPLVIGVVSELSRAQQLSSMAALADDLGVSERTLRRRCTDALGYGPKTLDRILRFRRALRLLRQRQAVADVAFETGYADQAHLTNEFRRLADTTPAAVVNSRQTSISANGYN